MVSQSCPPLIFKTLSSIFLPDKFLLAVEMMKKVYAAMRRTDGRGIFAKGNDPRGVLYFIAGPATMCRVYFCRRSPRTSRNYVRAIANANSYNQEFYSIPPMTARLEEEESTPTRHGWKSESPVLDLD